MRYVVLTMVIEREGKYYVSRCSELGIASSGQTEEEALRSIEDATEVYLNTLEDLGECEEFLQRQGVPVYCNAPASRKMPSPPRGGFVYSQVMPVGLACA